MTTNHTLRPVIDELRAADPMDAPPGAHVHFPEVSWPETAPPGAPPSRYLRRRTAEFASMPGHAASLPIGMIEPRYASAALAADDAAAVARSRRQDPTAELAVEAALDEIISGLASRRSLLRRIVPTTAAAFWMLVSALLAFLLARAEGWL